MKDGRDLSPLFIAHEAMCVDDLSEDFVAFAFHNGGILALSL